MKFFYKILIILYLIIITASFTFSNNINRVETIDKKIIKNNIVYIKNETEPFTGKIIDKNIHEEYKNGIRHGLFKGIFLDKENSFLYEGFYTEGLKHGKWKIKYKTGEIKALLEYHYDKPYGQWEYYYNSKKLEGYENFENGIISGKVAFFDKLGNTILETSYYNGLLNGKFLKYSSPNVLETVANFQYGKLHGVIKLFSKKGIPLLEGKYFQNKRIDLWKFFYNTGDIKTTVFYKDGKRDGEMIIYDKIGVVVDKVLYKDGQEIGTKKENGKENQENSRDKLISKFKKFNKELNYEKYNEILSNL